MENTSGRRKGTTKKERESLGRVSNRQEEKGGGERFQRDLN